MRKLLNLINPIRITDEQIELASTVRRAIEARIAVAYIKAYGLESRNLPSVRQDN